jgi:hypothetical protein
VTEGLALVSVGLSLLEERRKIRRVSLGYQDEVLICIECRQPFIFVARG